MRRLFIQFYLLLMACFLAAVLLMGLVYELTAERAGNRYLEGLVRDPLDRLSQQLAGGPPTEWPAELHAFSRRLELPLHTGLLAEQPLADEDLAFLTEGNIVIVEEDDTFLQRIPGTGSVVIVGPVPYLSFLHEMRWFDLGLLLILGLSLGVPILLWMRPHWRGLQTLVAAAQRLGAGDLSARTRLPSASSLANVGQTFDQMAERLQALIATRKQLTDAIAHELRTPLVRLRYRLAMLDTPLPDAAQADLERDIQALEFLIEEMLTYSRLNQPELPLLRSDIDLCQWARGRLRDWQALGPQRTLSLSCPPQSLPWQGDVRLLDRAMDNLIGNAMRHAQARVQLRIALLEDGVSLEVLDDGPGIAPEQAEQVFEPFVRLDDSRDRRTGGCGLGLAIVRSIAHLHGGEVALLPGQPGAHFRLWLPVHLDTNGHQHLTDAKASPP